MEQLKTIDPSQINIEDFMGTTVPVEPIGRPEESFVAQFERIGLSKEGIRVAVLKRFPGLGDPIEINLETFINGGADSGLQVPGLLEEAVLRYSPQEGLADKDLIAGIPRNLWMFQ